MEVAEKVVESVELVIEAVELGDIDSLEEEIVPCTGCGCECTENPD